MPRAEAFMWQGNPRKWRSGGTMADYVADEARYIYWATPQLRDQIKVGDKA
jgi:hypothetical protein